MKVTLKILALPMLSQAVGAKKLAIDFEGETVNDLIEHLVERFGPKAKQALYDEKGELDLMIQILLNEKEWVTRDRLDTLLKEGDTLAFMFLAAGGYSRREVRMAKVVKRPFTPPYPVPAVLVTCGHGEQANIITIAWTGTLCSKPPQLGIGVRPQRHSHSLIKKTGEFVVNVPPERLLEKVDYCGMVSGREVDKFEAAGLTAAPASVLKTPIIVECPINIECRVTQIIPLGSHDLFIGEVVAAQIDEEILNERGRIDYGKAKPFTLTGDEYWSLGSLLGKYGFSGG